MTNQTQMTSARIRATTVSFSVIRHSDLTRHSSFECRHSVLSPVPHSLVQRNLEPRRVPIRMRRNIHLQLGQAHPPPFADLRGIGTWRAVESAEENVVVLVF